MRVCFIGAEINLIFDEPNNAAEPVTSGEHWLNAVAFLPREKTMGDGHKPEKIESINTNRESIILPGLAKLVYGHPITQATTD